MRKTKEQKAITLIALIITIVVLLILAVVAINAVTGDGIIQHATNAKTSYENAQTKEEGILSHYQDYITSQIGWKQSGTKVTKDDITLNVGDIVNYVSNTNTSIKWAVLGAQDGKILLVSTTNIGEETLSGKDDYINDAGIEKINNKCANYDNGEGAVRGSARSIKVEDINRITGYNPLKTGDGKIYNEGKVGQYLNKVNYTIQNGVVCYTSNVNENLTTSTYSEFLELVEGEAERGVSVTSTIYLYYPVSLSLDKNTTGEIKGISTESDAYKLLFGDVYWLANSYVGASDGFIIYGIRCVSFYNNNASVGGQYLWRTFDGIGGDTRGIRAVVSLEANAQFTPDEDNENTYNISLPNK